MQQRSADQNTTYRRTVIRVYKTLADVAIFVIAGTILAGLMALEKKEKYTIRTVMRRDISKTENEQMKIKLKYKTITIQNQFFPIQYKTSYTDD